MKLNTKKLTITGILLALALIIGTIEHSMPPIIPTLPFVKIGFSNIVIMFTAVCIGFFPAFIISALKSILVPLFLGNPIMIIYSLSASFVSLTIVCLLLNIKKISLPAIGIVSAIIHNVVQLIVASIILQNTYSFGFLPYCTLVAFFAGMATGIITYLLVKFLPKKLFNVY